MDEYNNRLRAESGGINDTDPVMSLLYSLLRDHVPPSTIEGLVREIEAGYDRGDRETVYSNGWLAQYARNLAKRLERCRG